MPTDKKSKSKVWTMPLVLAGIFGFLGLAQAGLAQYDPMTLLKKQQIESMKNITTISCGLADYFADHGNMPTQNGTYEAADNFYKDISPFYLKELPLKDSWGGKFLVYCGQACNGKYGLKDCDQYDFLVVSLGRDGKKDDWEYDYSNAQGGLYKLLGPADFDGDLIMWNGTWIRAPLPDKEK